MIITAPKSPILTAGWRTPTRPQTQAWVEAENKLTFDYLRQYPAARSASMTRVAKLWDYEKFGVPHKEGGRYFFSKNTGLQNQSVIYTAPSLDAAPTELLDPNKLSDDGTVSLSSYAISEDGKYMAYGLNTSGSDWIDWHVKEVATGHDLPDHLQWSKFSGASWTKDGKGFFYSRYDAAGRKNAASNGQLLSRSCITTRSAPSRPRTCSFTSARTKRNGDSAASVTDDGQYLDHRREPRHGPEEPRFLPLAQGGADRERRSSNCCAERGRAVRFRRQRGRDVLFL